MLVRIVPLALLALTVTGCMSPWLKRDAAVPTEKPTPALVSGFVVRFDDGDQQKSLLAAAVDAAQNAGLDEFGKKATEMLASRLAELGYTATYDGPRTKTLDAVQISSNQATAALTGQWRHPDASYWVPQTVDSLFVKPADIIGKIKSADGKKEFFAFADITIMNGGMFMKEPYVVVRAVVYDQDAKKVLDLGGMGAGNSTFMFSDRSPQNLEVALTNAFESLKTTKEQAL